MKKIAFLISGCIQRFLKGITIKKNIRTWGEILFIFIGGGVR